MKHLSCDIETYSSVDIKKSGLYRYAQSPDFQILLFAYSYDGNPVQIVDLAQGELLPEIVVKDLADPDVIKHAYNAAFEWYCLNRFYYTPLEQWRCTQLHGLYCGYPMGLGNINNALGIPEDKKKMGVGLSLIRLFCCPTKPTAKNGQRTRTLPHHEPDKWNLFKTYCKQDVVAEMEVERRLSAFPVPDAEQKYWQLDQLINVNGVGVDLELVDSALAINAQVSGDLMTEAQTLTGLDNPNAVAQLTKWLESETGEEVDNLRKDTVSDMISTVDDGAVKRMLEIRRELSKTSVKKYVTMETAVCADKRIRGLTQFYGANRTGRFSGRLVQMQNLPQNHLKTLDLARDLLKHGKLDALKLIYGNVPDVLSQLIRTAFVPEPGNVFHVADYSAIEARVIAWLAGETWRLEVFKNGGDIYCASASQMFGIPVEKNGINGHLRQKGKVAELACIAKGQLVTTDQGLVPIEEVTPFMRVWDGEEWVKQDGAVYQGRREVITYEGLTATADHTVWVEGKSWPIWFANAAASGAHLVQSGAGWSGIRKCRDYQPGTSLESGMAGRLCTDQMQRMRDASMDELQQSDTRKVKRLPDLLAATSNTEMAGSSLHVGEAALHEPERRWIQKLRRTWNKIRLWFHLGSWTVDAGKLRYAGQINGDRPNRQRRELRGGESSLGYSREEQPQQALHGIGGMETGRMALRADGSPSETGAGDDTRGNHSGCLGGRTDASQELARHTEKVEVYDLLNCGPRKRFTVSGVLVHNCGYQGGVGALKAMGADKMGLSDDQLGDIIRRWREASPRIRDMWYALENAAVSAIKTGRPCGTHGLLFAYVGDNGNDIDFLTITLPSGRKLFYVKPFFEVNKFGREAINYWGMDQVTKKWCAMSTYGGKLAENVTQAIARDCLIEAIARLYYSGFSHICFHVHDEIILETPNWDDLDTICEIMGQPLPWAPGLLLRADGFTTPYYKKD